MASMFNNIYDVEQDINKMMSDTALSFGRLDANGYGPMTASTFGQAEMFGRSLGTMLGGKDPRMEEAELMEELMRRHPDPKTKAEILAVAKDAAEMGLSNLQTQMIEIASAMEEKKKANDTDIKFLTNHMSLTNSNPEMLTSYLKSIGNTPEMIDDSLLSDAKKEFKTILDGYGTWLRTKGKTPSEIHDYAFTNKGQIENQELFRAYLEPITKANKIAKWLYDNNVVIKNSGNGNGGGNDDESGINKKSDIDIESGNQTSVVEALKNRGEDFHTMSKADKFFESQRHNLRLVDALTQIYEPLRKGFDKPEDGKGKKASKLSISGSLGELFMDKETLDAENKRDAVKDWMGGGMGFNIRKSSAMEHFQSNGPEALAKFAADPVKYFEENILRTQYYNEGPDGIMGTPDDVLKDPEREIPTLWGIN